MATARKCDRCGSYYDSYNIINNSEKINGIMLINIYSDNRYFSHGSRDLCPACSNELMKWFKKENKDA